VVRELGLPEKLAGVLMGSAACLEIPTMLIAGYLAKQLGKRFLMRFAVVAGVIFYGCILFTTGAAMLIALQLLNAIFIGILAGIGMLYFQDLMPGQAGAATTLFTNSTRAGWILAGSLAGVIAQFWTYHAVFYAALAMVVGSVLCIWNVKNVDKPAEEVPEVVV
jgi:SET family sugar efflux transporter-like MFS transporter